MSAVYEFHGDLPSLLRKKWGDVRVIEQPVTRRASIKDVLESFGLPHTEIGEIKCRGRDVDFTFQVEDHHFFEIHPVRAPWNVTEKTLLRPEPLDMICFIVDVNVGRLARYLRMAGFDVLYDSGWHDAQITTMIERQPRIVLTRDLGLLKRKSVEFGRYVRSENPVEQLREVIHLLGLGNRLQPFTRCLECNTLLQAVAKQDVLHRLEPLTRKYYQTFSLCPTCDRVYWAGSHVEEMRLFFPENFRLANDK